MVKRALMLAFGAALLRSSGAQPLQVQAINADNAVRDASGRLWLAGRQGQRSGLFRWDGKSWILACSQPTGTSVSALVPRRDGGVLCLWNTSRQEKQTTAVFHFSVQNGSSTRWLGQWKYQYPTGQGSGQVQLSADGTGAVWVNKRRVSLVSLDGKVRRIYTIPPAQMGRFGKKEIWRDEENPILSLEDGAGQLWLWSDGWENGSNAWSVRGLLRWDGHKMTHHATLPGFPKGEIYPDAVARKDAQHLWVSLGKAGIYEVDCRTLRARRIATPSGKVFENAQQITALGSDIYVVFGPRWTDDDDDSTQFNGHLWRYRSGQWRQIIGGMDANSGYESFRRPIVVNKAGLWTASRGNGVWFVPHGDGQPVSLNWRRGVPLGDCSFVLDSPHGVMAGNWNAMALIKDAKALAQRQAAPGMVVLPTYIKLAQDKQRRVWAVVSLRANALSEWNGTRWVNHAVPRGYKLSNVSELGFDRLGRVWLLADYRNGQTAIFDARSPGGSWQVFRDYQTALLAQLDATPKNPPLPEFQPEDVDSKALPWQTPDVRGRRLCYLDAGDAVHYFDGKSWQRWPATLIAGVKLNEANIYAPVYFGQGGVLTISINGTVWRYEGKAGWKRHESSEEEQDQRLVALMPMDNEVVPEHELPREGDSRALVVADRDRNGWYIWKRQLYKAVPGLSAPQFSPGANQPFLDERSLNRVFVDKYGTVFCDTGEESVILLPSASPDTRAVARAVEVDAFVIECSASSPGPHRFGWRLDGGRWSAPQLTSKIQLKELPGGAHRVEVAAIDRQLRRDPTPAVVTFSVNLDAARQVADFIADLSSPDYVRREKAVQGLAKQPQRALPALRAARVKADGDLKWWIDAAVQAADAGT